MLMLGQLQMNECPLRWITIDDLRAESLIEATPKGSDSNCPCNGQGGTKYPGPIDQELWQHEIPHAGMASCVLRTKIGPVMVIYDAHCSSTIARPQGPSSTLFAFETGLPLSKSIPGP
jgi:hypothetical protein